MRIDHAQVVDAALALMGTVCNLPPPISKPDKPEKPHHWIEEGSLEDFRRCVMESDLPWFCEVTIGSNGYNIVGAFTGRLELTGTYIDPVIWQHNNFNANGDAFFVPTFASVERRVIEMLLNRPELRDHESKTKALAAAAH